jgi:hypothetical protein
VGYMTRYIVIVSKTIQETYEVYAATASEAKELVKLGEVDPDEDATVIKNNEVIFCKPANTLSED